MSPEQKAGREVTTRSDLYALGLVLHEMFTGRRCGKSESSPTEIVKDLDPTIERVILRCLDPEPRNRPSSALNVAMWLPGGDPSPEIQDEARGRYVPDAGILVELKNLMKHIHVTRTAQTRDDGKLGAMRLNLER
jgi:serine/threonine protein kinase